MLLIGATNCMTSVCMPLRSENRILLNIHSTYFKINQLFIKIRKLTCKELLIKKTIQHSKNI